MSVKLFSTTLLTIVVTVSVSAAAPRKAAPAVVNVFKTPTCGCCSKWVEHMRKAGFIVHAQDVADAELQKLKAKFGVPETAKSCHTARIGAYVVEGHIPASDVKRLLKERPKIAGLTLPGMPVGSPGMEVQGVRAQPYNVLSFDKQGRTQVFSTQKP